MPLRLLLLGGARLLVDGTPLTGRAAQRRRLALVTLLARSGRRTLTRERLVAYLWPEHPPDAARRLLSEAVYVLRRELGEGLLHAVGDELTLDAAVASDVDDFLAATAAGDAARAVALYGGPFLDGWWVRDAPEFERWVESERVDLGRAYVRMLRARSEACEAAGDWAGAAAGWQAILRVDPYGSTAVLHAGRALAAAGEPAAALQLLAAHEQLLRDEFGVELDDDLTALGRDIRDGRSRPQRRAPAPSAAARDAAAAPGQPEGAASASPRGIRPTVPAIHAPADDAVGDVAGNAPSPTAPAPASSGETGAPQDAAPAGAPTPPTPPRRRRRALVGLALGLAAAAGLAVGAIGPPLAAPHRRAAAPDPLHVAVLYFEDRSANRSLRHLADGLAESLIRELSSVPALRVLSSDAVRPYRDGHLPADSVGRALRAGTVVTAALDHVDGQIRVVARLIDAASGDQLATVQVEEPRAELFAIEDSLAGRTVVAMRRRLGEAVRLRDRRGTAGRRNGRALDLVLQAEHLRRAADAARTRGGTAASQLAIARRQLATADSLLATAEALDPTFPLPAIARGWVAVAAGRLEHGAARVVALAPGLGHVERALAIVGGRAADDARLRAEVLHLRGVLRVQTAIAAPTYRAEDATLRQGTEDLRAAVALDSTRAGAWAALSRVRWIGGDFLGAEDAARRALDADAFLEDGDEVLTWAWRSAYARADRAAALQWCRRGRTLLPDDWHFTECELTILRLDAAGLTGQLPDAARAWALVRDLERRDPPEHARSAGRPYSPVYRRLVAAAVSAAAGARDSARAVLARETRRVRPDAELATDVLYDAAFVHLVLGEPTRARALLDAYVRARPDLRPLLAADRTMHGAVAPPAP